MMQPLATTEYNLNQCVRSLLVILVKVGRATAVARTGATMFRQMISAQASALEQTLSNAPIEDESLMREAQADLTLALTKALQALKKPEGQGEFNCQ